MQVLMNSANCTIVLNRAAKIVLRPQSGIRKGFSSVSRTTTKCGCKAFQPRILFAKPDQFASIISSLSLFSRSTPPTVAPVPEFDSLSILRNSSISLQELGPIPDPPTPPDPAVIQALQEQIANNIRELNLGSYMTPAGWVQNLLDIVHNGSGLPWWEVIALTTMFIRLLTLPVMISSQRRSTIMMENKPEMDKLMKRIEEAKQMGDAYQTQMAMFEMQHFMKEKHLPSMGRMVLPLLANGFIFMSYFIALRGMTSANLFSMRSEGTLWFTDLTAADPTMILPCLCGLSTLLVMETGIEFGTAAGQMKPAIRWIMRLSPLFIIIFGKSMPTAVLCYWFSSNCISLLISLAFRNAAVRRFLKIPPLPPRTTRFRDSIQISPVILDNLRHPTKLWMTLKETVGFRKKKAPTGMQIRKADVKAFKSAGDGPVPPTFSFNPKVKYKEAFEKKSGLPGVLSGQRQQEKAERTTKSRASA